MGLVHRISDSWILFVFPCFIVVARVRFTLACPAQDRPPPVLNPWDDPKESCLCIACLAWTITLLRFLLSYIYIYICMYVCMYGESPDKELTMLNRALRTEDEDRVTDYLRRPPPLCSCETAAAVISTISLPADSVPAFCAVSWNCIPQSASRAKSIGDRRWSTAQYAYQCITNASSHLLRTWKYASALLS